MALFHLSVCTTSGYCCSLLTSGFSYCVLSTYSGRFLLLSLISSSQSLFLRCIFFRSRQQLYPFCPSNFRFTENMRRNLKSKFMACVFIILYLKMQKNCNLLDKIYIPKIAVGIGKRCMSRSWFFLQLIMQVAADSCKPLSDLVSTFELQNTTILAKMPSCPSQQLLGLHVQLGSQPSVGLIYHLCPQQSIFCPSKNFLLH